MYRVLTALIIALSLALPATGASLLPDGMQTFVDSNGVPLAGGQVCLYVPGTSTPKLTWQNRQQTVANTSPCVTLNSAGQAILWGYGQYRQILYDLNGNVKWDQLVADYVSDQQNNAFNWAGTSAGSANAQTISVQPQLMAYSAGQLFAFLAGFTNSGPATLNVNGLGARNLFKLTSAGAVPLTGAEISAGGVVFTVYDGSEFQIVSTSLPAGPTILVPQITNNVATHGASYTVQNGDDHSTIVLTGSTGGQTLIVNSHSSYSDGSFSFQVCNASTRRWSVTTADGGTVFSFPKQCYLVMNNGSGLVPSAQQRYYVPSPQLYVSTSSCSDSNNDGLAAGSPLCTVGHAITVLQTLFDTAGTVSYLQLADGTYTEQINFSGNVPGGGDLIRINGNNSNPTNVKLHAPSGAGNSAVMVRDFGTLQISNAELACPSSGGGTAVNASQLIL
jgi:hypothetical protein